MFSKFIQFVLVITSIAPVLVTFWFREFKKYWNIFDGLPYFLAAVLLFIVLKVFINLAKQKLESITIKMNEISSADQESIVYIFTYLTPLLDIDIKMIIFLLILFAIIVFTTNIYHFNPMLGILGYHQYEVKIDGTSFILITKKTLVNTKQIKYVVQLTNYIILEK